MGNLMMRAPPTRTSPCRSFDWDENLPLIGEFLDFSSLLSTKYVCKGWSKHFHGNNLYTSAMSELFGTGSAKTVMEIENQAKEKSEEKNIAVVTPEKSEEKKKLPVWRTLCDHIFALKSRVAQSNNITTSLALAICHEWLMVLNGAHLPSDVTSDDIDSLCGFPGLLAITCVSMAIKLEEGMDSLSLPQWSITDHDGDNVSRLKIIQAEEVILRCLKMGVPVTHSGQYYFPLRIQLIGIEPDHRVLPGTKAPAPRRLSLDRQKALLSFAHHALERGGSISRPSKQALVAAVLCLALTAAVNNHWRGGGAQSACASAERRPRTPTPRLDALKRCLVVALLAEDVARAADKPTDAPLPLPLLALEDLDNGFKALLDTLRELRRLQSHLLPSSHHASLGLRRTRAATSSSAALGREDSLLVHAWTSILASPRGGQGQPSPPVLTEESVDIVNILCTLPDLRASVHKVIASDLCCAFRHVLCDTNK